MLVCLWEPVSALRARPDMPRAIALPWLVVRGAPSPPEVVPLLLLLLVVDDEGTRWGWRPSAAPFASGAPRAAGRGQSTMLESSLGHNSKPRGVDRHADVWRLLFLCPARIAHKYKSTRQRENCGLNRLHPGTKRRRQREHCGYAKLWATIEQPTGTGQDEPSVDSW